MLYTRSTTLCIELNVGRHTQSLVMRYLTYINAVQSSSSTRMLALVNIQSVSLKELNNFSNQSYYTLPYGLGFGFISTVALTCNNKKYPKEKCHSSRN